MNITIRGNEINEGVLREIRSLLIAPMKPLVVTAVLAVYIGAVAVAAVAKLWAFLPIFTVLMLLIMIGQPYMQQGRVITKMLDIMRRTYGKPACAFDYTFEETCVRSVNVKTRETVRLPYADFVKMARGKSVIAMVTRRGHLVVVDREKAGEENCEAVLDIIRNRCKNVLFR